MDVFELCREEGLVVEAVFPSAHGIVARVRDHTGHRLIVKGPQPPRHHCLDEGAALAAWSGSGVTPQLVRQLAGGGHLREFIVGQPLWRQSDRGAAHAGAAGRLLATLHAHGRPHPDTGSPHGWLIAESHFILNGGRLDSAMQSRVAALRDVLVRVPAESLIHGDFFHRNILLTETGLVAIDPLARRDLAAFDLVSLAITLPGRPPEATLSEVVEGYGSRPPALDEYLEWALLRNRHYRAVFDAGGGGAVWEPCFVAGSAGAAASWSVAPPGGERVAHAGDGPPDMANAG